MAADAEPADQRRVAVTDTGRRVLTELREDFGEILLVQSGGCCDGSAPMCVRADEFSTSDQDVHVANIAVDGGVVPFWQSEHQYTYSRHLFMTVDARPGFGSEFSLEATLDMELLIVSRILTDAEEAEFGSRPVLSPRAMPAS
jgi:uncharacterized protein